MSNPSHHVTNDRLLSVQEVMEVLGLGRTSIYKLIEEGTLPNRHVLGRRKFWMSEVYAAVNGASLAA